MSLYQYDTITCKTTDLIPLLDAKDKEGWEIDGWQLMSNQAGIFVILRKEIGLDYLEGKPVQIIADGAEPNILPGKTMSVIDPLKKRPGRKLGSKNKVNNARSKQD